MNMEDRLELLDRFRVPFLCSPTISIETRKRDSLSAICRELSLSQHVSQKHNNIRLQSRGNMPTLLEVQICQIPAEAHPP